MSNYITVKEMVQDVRDRLEDTACDLQAKSIMSWLNLTLPRLAREPGLDKLFKFHDTFELASIKSNGEPSAVWRLNDKDPMGMIIDIKTLRVLDNSGCGIFNVPLCYMDYEDFFDCNPLPENNPPGTPSEFTLEEIGGQTKIIFDRPIDSPHSIDMTFTAFHPRLRKLEDLVRIPQGFLDILNEYVVILYNESASDMATSRALYENYDILVDGAREMLAKRKSSLPFRLLGRSF